VLVQRGTLKPGSILVAGESYGKVKSMTNSSGKMVKEAGPSDPVEVSGWKTLPDSGETVYQVEQEVVIFLTFFSK
jgi:translation initiation factor IF-2